MGHVFGLNENASNSTTIMYPSSAGRSTYIPTQRDANGIYAIYGGN